MPSFDPVIAVSRGIEVLRVVNELGEATITQVHRETNIHKSTVLRMLETLMHDGYVTRLPNSPHYIPTGRCLQLSNGLHRTNRLVQIATPMMSAFRKSIGWPSDIALFDHDAMVIVASNREFGVMSLNRNIGARVPMLGSSLGLAYLAFCPPSERDAILDQLAKSENVWDREARNRRRIIKLLDDMRKMGYSISNPRYRKQMYAELIWGLSVPILAGHEVAATMNLIFLTSSMSIEDGVAKYLASLQVVAKDIGDAIANEFHR